ncbi:MAG: aminopeptidase P family protein [Thermoleophilia bacterium]|nr:aminopeptidase P family protein [Thermoleophilia bacterium]
MKRITPFELSTTERDRRWSAVRHEMGRRGLQALIVHGSYACYRDSNANLQYMTNVNDEGYLLFPLEHEPTLYTFENRLDPTWVDDWRGAIPFFGKTIAGRVDELGLSRGRIGVSGVSGLWGEYGGFPWATYVSLQKHLPSAEVVDATDLVENARRIKSAEEVRCLEIGCQAAQQVFAAMRETAGVGVEDTEVRAAIQDALFRNDCDQGSMILYCQGKDILHGGQSGGLFGPTQHKRLELGDIILMEIDATYRGYKAQYNVAFAIGEPDEEWQRLLACAAEAYRAGLEVLRPGIQLKELEEALTLPIGRAGFVFANPAFHGLGLSLELPMGTYPRVGWYPDLSERVDTGMVLEFEPHPVTQNGKRGVSIGSAILVTEDGCRQIDPLYTPDTPVIG